MYVLFGLHLLPKIRISKTKQYFFVLVFVNLLSNMFDMIEKIKYNIYDGSRCKTYRQLFIPDIKVPG